MGKLYFNQNQLIRLIILILISFLVKNSYAEWKAGPPFPGSNGSVRPLYDSSKVNLNPHTMYKTDTGHYGFKTTISQTIEHVPTGATRAGVPTIFEASVSRKAVLSGAFGLVKRGAALGSRLSGWGTAAYFAYEAYQAVKSPLESEGYKFDEASGEFYKDWPARNCIWDSYNNKVVECYGVDSSIISAMYKGGKSEAEAKVLMQSKMEGLARLFWNEEKIRLDKRNNDNFWKFFNLSECRFNLNGGDCSVVNGNDSRSGVSFVLRIKDREILTADKFLQIATPSIDGNPTPFVEGTGKPEYQENIKVPAGTVVTIGPITPENGKPVQVTITFGQDQNGNTTAKVETTRRPDLDPGSPEAPNKKPDTDPNPDGKPDKKPDGKHDKKPDDKPDKKPDDKPDDKPDPDDKDDPKKEERPKEDDKPKEDGGLLCKVFPKILACDELPEKEEPNLEIPKETIDLKFTTDNTFKEYGECPAPVTFQALGTEYKISLEPACNLAAMIRPFIIAMAWLVASFFVSRVVRNNA